ERIAGSAGEHHVPDGPTEQAARVGVEDLERLAVDVKHVMLRVERDQPEIEAIEEDRSQLRLGRGGLAHGLGGSVVSLGRVATARPVAPSSRARSKISTARPSEAWSSPRMITCLSSAASSAEARDSRSRSHSIGFSFTNAVPSDFKVTTTALSSTRTGATT